MAYSGVPISGELFDVPMDVLRDRLLPAKSPKLELGVIALEDNRSVLSMVLRRPVLSDPELVDITDFGSWQSYREEIAR